MSLGSSGVIGSLGVPRAGRPEVPALPLIRRASMTLMTSIATAWAIAMVVFGLSVIAQMPAGWLRRSFGLSEVAWNLLGLASIAGGQFVFMFMVADRLCPKAGRLPGIWMAELAIAGIGLLAILTVGMVLLTGLFL